MLIVIPSKWTGDAKIELDTRQIVAIVSGKEQQFDKLLNKMIDSWGVKVFTSNAQFTFTVNFQDDMEISAQDRAEELIKYIKTGGTGHGVH